MRLSLVPVVVVLSLCCASKELGVKKGDLISQNTQRQNHLKKLMKQGPFKTISKEKLLREVKEHLARHRLKEKSITMETSKEEQAFISKTEKLKNKFKEPTTKDSFKKKKLPAKVTLPSPTQSPFVTRHFKIEHARQATLVKLPIDRPQDSDEVVDDEDAFTRDNLKDKMLLGTMTTEEDSDSDSNEPITDDSDDNEKEGDSAPGYVRGGDRVSEDEEKHEEETGSEKVHKEEQEMPLPPDDDNGNDVDGEDEDKNTEDEDERKPGHSSEDDEQPLHSSKKLTEDKNHKITPYEISDAMSQELMRLYGGNEDQTAAMIDRERHLDAWNKLRAFSARLRQNMFQRLRPSYPDTFGQLTDAALIPQFYVAQTLGIPRVPVKTALFLSPTASIYRPSYIGPPRSTNLLSQSSNQGYSINVDGLHGVFSKAPGFAVKFHSPNSEVTVVKKERVVNPMTTTRDHVLQINAK